MKAEQLRALTREDFHQRAAALKPETRMFIDGKLVDAKSRKRFETVNPANDEVLASVPLGDAEDVDLAVASARKAFKSGVWSRMEPRLRMEVMYRFADLINDQALEFGLLDSLDVGKPITDMLNANGDVAAAALTVRYFGEAIDKIEGIVTHTAASAFHYIVRQPLGVVAVQESPLAVCDAQSMKLQDFVATDLKYQDRTGEVYSVAFNPEHRWFYFPKMERNEALLLKCYDSAADGRARFTAHTAFEDPTTPPDAAPRESIEARTLVFFAPEAKA